MFSSYGRLALAIKLGPAFLEIEQYDIKKRMIMRNGKRISNLSLQIITFILILMWVPVTIDKFWDLGEFHFILLNQPFPNWWADILYWLLPLLELLIVIFLVWPERKLQHLGMLLSTVLLTLFTSYIALGLLDAFDQRPCGCGSVLKSMTWEQHFWFNVFFIFLSGAGTYLTFHNEETTFRMMLLRAGRPKDTYRKII